MPSPYNIIIRCGWHYLCQCTASKCAAIKDNYWLLFLLFSFVGDDGLQLSEVLGELSSVKLDKTLETSSNWADDVRSYWQRASSNWWPVRCWIIFSDTPAWNSLVAPKARRLWFVNCWDVPAFWHICFNISFNVFFRTGVLVNHSSDESVGIEGSGLK